MPLFQPIKLSSYQDDKLSSILSIKIHPYIDALISEKSATNVYVLSYFVKSYLSICHKMPMFAARLIKER